MNFAGKGLWWHIKPVLLPLLIVLFVRLFLTFFMIIPIIGLIMIPVSYAFQFFVNLVAAGVIGWWIVAKKGGEVKNALISGTIFGFCYSLIFTFIAFLLFSVFIGVILGIAVKMGYPLPALGELQWPSLKNASTLLFGVIWLIGGIIIWTLVGLFGSWIGGAIGKSVEKSS